MKIIILESKEIEDDCNSDKNFFDSIKCQIKKKNFIKYV